MIGRLQRMMDECGMYKDPVKLNAFMNHVPLTFAVGALQG